MRFKLFILFFIFCACAHLTLAPTGLGKDAPLTEEQYGELAIAAYDAADYEKAIFYLNKILDLSPDTVYARRAIASAFAKQEGLEKAIATYGQGGIEVSPKGIVIKYMGDYGESISLEYLYLSMRFGIQGKDWDLKQQQLLEESGRTFDELTVTDLKTGEIDVIRFDITEPFEILNKQVEQAGQ